MAAMWWHRQRAWILAAMVLVGGSVAPWTTWGQELTPIQVPWWITNPPSPPEAGTMIFQANWSDSASYLVLYPLNRWRLVGDSLVGSGKMQPILNPPPPPQDYAVEAEVQHVGQTPGVFELILWEPWYDRYVAHFESGEAILVDYRGGITRVPQIELARVPFDPGDGLHLYRGEVQGNDLRLVVDGTLVLSHTFLGRNSAFAAPGVYSNTELRIRTFRVIAL